MSTSRIGRVLVATSGSASSKSAITFAARTAASRGLALELIHVVTPTVSVGPYAVAPDVVVRQAGREVLARGEQLARQVVPDIEVVSTLVIGARPDAIAQKTHGADLVVVGAPPHDLIGRLWTGSTVTGVAARSACPVAIIPARDEEPRHHRVLVGVKTTDHAHELLAAAFAVASQTGSELRIIHAWRLLSPYDNAVADRLPVPEWELGEQRAIEAMLIDLKMAYPTVTVHVDLVHGQAAHELVHASELADVLVISRPRHGGFVHHLGATARAIIREGRCPILIVPPNAAAATGHPAETVGTLAG
jgi:nucleotide-binding universal stress UspA family protein